MKNKKRKSLLPIGLLLLAIFLVIAVIFVQDKRLDLDSEEVTALYKYLGEVDIYHCGGLVTYGEQTITKDDISADNALCMAYYNTNKALIKENIISSNTTTSSKTKSCKVGDNTIFIANENTDECSYNTISKTDLNNSYKDIYGNDIQNYEDKFQITDSKICYLEGDMYYCGNTDTFAYSIGSDATVYRLMDKAIKSYNGNKIVISDYYLKVSNNGTCYKNGSSEELEECSKEIKSGAKVDADLIRNYGSLYKHTFIKDSNDNYYWSKSEPTHQWN